LKNHNSEKPRGGGEGDGEKKKGEGEVALTRESRKWVLLWSDVDHFYLPEEKTTNLA